MTTAVLSPASGLTPALLAEYHSQGFLIRRRLFAEVDLSVLASEADRLLTRNDLITPKNMRARWQPHVETGEYLFECFDPVVDIAPVFARYARDHRILDVVGAIYGEEACLRHDQLIYKPPGSLGYGLHQDFVGWPGFPRSFLTVVVALDAGDAETGCIEAFPGYHRQGYLSPLDNQYHELPAGTVDEARKVDVALQPGDTAFFGCYLPHRSGPNRSQRWRRHLFFCYNARSEGGDQYRQHYDYYNAWKREKYLAHGQADVFFQ
jgi:hypothetical protein